MIVHIRFFVFCIVIASCKQPSVPNIKSCAPSVQKVSQRILQNVSFKIRYNFPLDDSLVIASASQVQVDPNSKQLIVLDKYFQRIVYYDLSKQTRVYQINLSKSEFGTNPISGFKFISQDSLLLFSSSHNIFYIINKAGRSLLERSLKKPINSDPYVSYPSPFVQNAAPIYWQSGKIITTGYLFGEHEKINPAQRFCRITTTLSDEDSDFDIPYPKIYDTANWGGDFYRSVYSLIDPKGVMYISFPAEHRLLQIVGKKNNWVDGSYPGMKCIPAIKDSKDSLRNRQYHFKINEHYATNYSYKNILFLPKQNIFLRVLEKPLKLSELNSDRTGIKRCELILFDSNHKYINRINLPEELSSNNFFLTNEGICFLNTKNKNENVAQYSLLNINVK